MPKKSEVKITREDYLNTLEKAKKQYQQYVEISQLYTLPIQREKEEETVKTPIPSLEHPLTSNANFQK